MSEHVKPSSLWICKQHGTNNGKCMSCAVAIDFNVGHRYCECGEKAIGYRVLSAKHDVEFFCDAHFQDVPEVSP